MAIRFHCKGCGQLLGIGSRKAGTEIECPRCGLAQTVPSEEVAGAALAMSESDRAEELIEETSEVVVSDDELTVIDVVAQRAAVRPWPISPSTLPPAPPPAVPPTVAPLPPGTILYRRRTIYVHGVLFVLLGGCAFAAGYFVGRGDANRALPVARQDTANQRVLIEGKLYYETGAGSVAVDAGAVFIALPAGKVPDEPLSTTDLRPRDPSPTETNRHVRAIEDLGGVYVRADDSGAFTAVLPKHGKYHLLIISRQTRRGARIDVDATDLSEISRYFHRAAHFVGRHKYHWALQDVTVPTLTIQHNFGRDGEE